MAFLPGHSRATSASLPRTPPAQLTPSSHCTWAPSGGGDDQWAGLWPWEGSSGSSSSSSRSCCRGWENSGDPLCSSSTGGCSHWSTSSSSSSSASSSCSYYHDDTTPVPALAPSAPTSRSVKPLWAPLSLLLISLGPASALDNGLGRLPPMGYSTWNDMGCEGVSTDSMRAVVSSLVSKNLHKLGYEYINIDDCWALERDGATGRLTPDFGAFPGGIKELADDIHSQGLKFGLYTDRGLWTCGARPGSAGREEIDSNTFADWGVDFLKIDSCNAPRTPREAMQQYARWRDALNSTGRSIFLSVCGWSPWYAEVGQALGNSWRMSRDVNGAREMWNAVAINSQLARHAGPGAWNDPDCLIGTSPHARVSLSEKLSRTQFNLWSIMAAPLIIGANMRELNSFDLETYSNTEVIAVDQDPLARQGTILWENCPPTNVSALVAAAEAGRYDQLPHCQQLWAKPLLGGDWAALLVNWGPAPTQMSIQASNLRTMGFFQGAGYRDLWKKQELGVKTDTFYVQVAGEGGSEIYRLRPSRVFQ